MQAVVHHVREDFEKFSYLAVALRALGGPLVFSKESTKGVSKCAIRFESENFDDADSPMTATLIEPTEKE